MSQASVLKNWQFTQIAAYGFGDPLNAYPHSMAWFKERLYVGTTRANFCLLKARVPLPFSQWPVKCPDDPYELDLRAQIWSYDAKTHWWQQVEVAPLIIGRTGELAPREIGYRGMIVFQGPSDPEPALYVATWAPTKGLGPLILRSVDGEEFIPVSSPGLGDSTVASYRSLASMNGRLFIAPTGRTGGRPNTPDNPIILESRDPAKGIWQPVNTPGFGDQRNLTIFEMAAFNGYLYAGTLNPENGYEVWKTLAQGDLPYSWIKVIGFGAYRGSLNEGVLSMCAFGNALYVGGCILNGGYDLIHKVGPAAAELIRIFPDDSWELIVGEPRSTPNGFKYPLSGFEPGFGNKFNGYFWRMAEFAGSLYLGTFDWSGVVPYLSQQPNTKQDVELANWLGMENLVNFEAGFDLFRSQDGVGWSPVTTTGFNNPYNFGARTMVATSEGLFIGTANPFGPDVAVRTADGWAFQPNPRGGIEVWLGKHT